MTTMNQPLQAVILAGGKGTRLESVSGGVPKPLVPVVHTPILIRQIELLAKYGVTEVFLTTGYQASLFPGAIGDGSRWGITVHFIEEPKPLGTAGGIAALKGRLKGDFIVMYGDVMVWMDIGKLIAYHRENGASATLVVHPNDHPFDSDLVATDADGRITALHPKPRPEGGPDLRNLVSAALYVIKADSLHHIEPDVKQDFIKHIFPRFLANGEPVYAYETPEYLKDMGTPDRLARVESDVRSGAVEARHLDRARPIVFLDRDGVLNREIDGVYHPDKLELIDGAPEAVRRLNRMGFLTAVVTNQPGVAKGFVTAETVAAVHRRLERVLGDHHAYIDAISWCPHHPEGGFDGELPELKIACECRKPSSGMLSRIGDRFPLDVSKSVLIGDSWRDMTAAHAFGIEAIGVSTGHGCSHRPPPQHALTGRPDVMVDDLAQAVALLAPPDAQLNSLCDRIGAQNTTVFIGGLARSGKSVLAWRVARALRARGQETCVVRIDDWLRPATDRGDSLAERYDLARLVADLASLITGEPVSAPGYDPFTRDKAPNPVPYSAEKGAALIIEGVPALLAARIVNKPHLAVYVKTDEDRRLAREAHWRTARGLPKNRRSDEEERKRVQESAVTADLVLVPSDLGAQTT